MPTIFTWKDGRIVSYNPDRDAKTGRWCYAPEVPDKCSRCFDENLRHYPAEGYIEEETEHGIVRTGVCHCCRPDCAQHRVITPGRET